MLIDEPGVATPYGGTLVAPSVGKMFEEILPYLGVTPSYTDLEAEELAVSTPNVIGYSKEKAIDILEQFNKTALQWLYMYTVYQAMRETEHPLYEPAVKIHNESPLFERDRQLQKYKNNIDLI